MCLPWFRGSTKRAHTSPAPGVFAVDGAFNSASTPDVSEALARVLQPFLGQIVTVLYLALLLWHRPFARPLHNLAQAGTLVLTWLALIVGESLFNAGTLTGGITAERQQGVGCWLAAVLLTGVSLAVGWALHGTSIDMIKALREKLPGVLRRCVPPGAGFVGVPWLTHCDPRVTNTAVSLRLIMGRMRVSSMTAARRRFSSLRRTGSRADSAVSPTTALGSPCKEGFCKADGVALDVLAEKEPERFKLEVLPIDERPPRVADGDEYTPSATAPPGMGRLPRVSDGERYQPSLMYLG